MPNKHVDVETAYIELEAENDKLKEDYKRLEQEYKLQLHELVKIKEKIDKVYRR